MKIKSKAVICVLSFLLTGLYTTVILTGSAWATADPGHEPITK